MYILEAELINDDEFAMEPTKLYVIPYDVYTADCIVRVPSDYEVNEWVEVAGKRILWTKLPRYIRNQLELKIEQQHQPSISY